MPPTRQTRRTRAGTQSRKGRPEKQSSGPGMPQDATARWGASNNSATLARGAHRRSFGLAGCSAMIADHTPTALGGLPEGAPQRSARPSAYPAVHDMPPRRGSVVLTDTEQKKLQDDLIAARNRTATKSKPSTLQTDDN